MDYHFHPSRKNFMALQSGYFMKYVEPGAFKPRFVFLFMQYIYIRLYTEKNKRNIEASKENTNKKSNQIQTQKK